MIVNPLFLSIVIPSGQRSSNVCAKDKAEVRIKKSEGRREKFKKARKLGSQEVGKQGRKGCPLGACCTCPDKGRRRWQKAGKRGKKLAGKLEKRKLDQ
jgi:hypothetical protein